MPAWLFLDGESWRRMTKPKHGSSLSSAETADSSMSIGSPYSGVRVVAKCRTSGRLRRFRISRLASTPGRPSQRSSGWLTICNSVAIEQRSRNALLAAVTRPSGSVTTNASGVRSTTSSTLCDKLSLPASSGAYRRIRKYGPFSRRTNDAFSRNERLSPAERTITASARPAARTRSNSSSIASLLLSLKPRGNVRLTSLFVGVSSNWPAAGLASTILRLSASTNRIASVVIENSIR